MLIMTLTNQFLSMFSNVIDDKPLCLSAASVVSSSLDSDRSDPNDIPNLPSLSETVSDGDVEICKETPPLVSFRVDADGYRICPRKATKTKGSKSSSPTAPLTPTLKDRISGFWRKVTHTEN